MNPDPQISSARMRQARREDLVTGLEGLEKQIYALETAYLEDTANVGNVIIGFDNYARSGRDRHMQPRKPAQDHERLFSLSSTTAKDCTPLYDDGRDIDEL